MSGKIQVVFLVEIPPNNCLRQQRALCLACTRILLLLAKFPNREHPSQLQWSYRLFSPKAPLKSSLVSTAQFYELHSDLLMKFFEDLTESSKEDSDKTRTLSHSWERCVYNALAATVQDFNWDAPEIRTPVRRTSQQKTMKLRERNSKQPSTNNDRNLIYIFTKGLGSISENDASLVKKVLPKPLLSQLHQKRIGVNWVHSAAHLDSGTSSEALVKALQTTGGTLRPISTFLTPGRLHGGAVTVTSFSSAIPPAAKVKECLASPECEEEEEFVWLCSKG